MAGTADWAFTRNSSNPWMQGLLGDTQWTSGGGSTLISVHIAAQSATPLLNFDVNFRVTATTPSSEEIAAFRSAMAAFSTVCNVSFQEVASLLEADVIFASVDNRSLPGLAGLAHFAPGAPNPLANDSQAIVAVNKDAFGSDGTSGFPRKGSFDYSVFLNELGHALGLAHPHDTSNGSGVFQGVTSDQGDLGAYNMNQGIYTMMSYNDGWRTGEHGASPSLLYGFEVGPMALDIAALQCMYGSNMTYRAGNDTYTLPGGSAVGTFYSCLWDAGGTDRIQGAANRENEIDLRAATLKAGPGGGGWVSYAEGDHGGFTIAKGVVIENARGAGRNDDIIGNEHRNLLQGRGERRPQRVGRQRSPVRRWRQRRPDRRGRQGHHGGRCRTRQLHLQESFGEPSRRAGRRDQRLCPGRDTIILTAIDANGGRSGNGAFRLDLDGSFSRGEIRQKVVNGTDLRLDMNLDSDSGIEMSIWLRGQETRLKADDFDL